MKRLSILLGFSLLGCSGQIQAPEAMDLSKCAYDKHALIVSLHELITNGSRFNGQRVSVEGILTLEFEGTAIFVDRDSFDNHAYMNSVGVDLIDDFWVEGVGHPDIDGEWTRIEGTYWNYKRQTEDCTFDLRDSDVGFCIHMAVPRAGRLADVNYVDRLCDEQSR